jgi:hypothetical protein
MMLRAKVKRSRVGPWFFQVSPPAAKAAERNAWMQGVFFLCFPYVCPEFVLVK